MTTAVTGRVHTTTCAYPICDNRATVHLWELTSRRTFASCNDHLPWFRTSKQIRAEHQFRTACENSRAKWVFTGSGGCV